MENTTREKIKKLTKLWYDYVSLDHHKDRDCHFYIEEDWAYGEEPVYCVNHDGYVGEAFSFFCKTREKAEKVLLKKLGEMIEEERKWAREVLENPKEWEEEQIEKAKMILEEV